MTDQQRGVAGLREYTDPSGALWTRRGRDTFEGRALAKQVRRPDVLVHYRYLGDVTVVGVDDRESFLARCEGAVVGSESSAFVGAEFRDSAGRHLVVVDEYC